MYKLTLNMTYTTEKFDIEPSLDDIINILEDFDPEDTIGDMIIKKGSFELMNKFFLCDEISNIISTLEWFKSQNVTFDDFIEIQNNAAIPAMEDNTCIYKSVDDFLEYALLPNPFQFMQGLPLYPDLQNKDVNKYYNVEKIKEDLIKGTHNAFVIESGKYIIIESRRWIKMNPKVVKFITNTLIALSVVAIGFCVFVAHIILSAFED